MAVGHALADLAQLGQRVLRQDDVVPHVLGLDLVGDRRQIVAGLGAGGGEEVVDGRARACRVRWRALL
jgi:hypothetical protein